MKPHYQGGFHGQKIRKRAIIQIGCDDIIERDFSELITESKRMPVPEIKTARCNEILCTQSGRSQPVPVETER